MEPLRRAFRGYEPAQVDRLVSGLYSQLEARLEEIASLRKENEVAQAELADFRSNAADQEREERAIREALVSAHRQAEEVLAQARKDAETLLDVARETAARYQEDLRGRIDDLNWQIERLNLQRQRFRADFRELLESHLTELVEPERSSRPIEAPVSEVEKAAEEGPLDSAEPEAVPVENG